MRKEQVNQNKEERKVSQRGKKVKKEKWPEVVSIEGLVNRLVSWQSFWKCLFLTKSKERNFLFTRSLIKVEEKELNKKKGKSKEAEKCWKICFESIITLKSENEERKVKREVEKERRGKQKD